MSKCKCRAGKTELEYEDRNEHRERMLSHYIVYFTQFTVIISYSTILTGLWPYLNKLDSTAGKSFLGYLIGFSALGQTIFSPFVGYCSNRLKSTRFLFVITILINVLAFCIHASCESFPVNQRKYWLLFSRFLAGTGSANVTICRSHIATTTLQRERRKAVSILSSSSTVALGLGAAVQFILIPLGDTGFWLIPNLVKLDMYTSVAWILIALSLLNIMMFVPSIFKEHSMIDKEVIRPGKESYKSKNYKFLACIFIALNFIVVFNSMFPKILGTPLAMDEFAMNRLQAVTLNSIVMCVGAAISFITVFVVNPLCSLVSEMKVLIFGLFIFVLGRTFFYPFGDGPAQTFDDTGNINQTFDIKERVENSTVGCPLSQKWCGTERKVLFYQFILGNVLESIGYTITIILTLAIFSKVLGSKKQIFLMISHKLAHKYGRERQYFLFYNTKNIFVPPVVLLTCFLPTGTWMGFLTSAGSIARVISPIFISTLYANYGPGFITLITNIFFAIAAFGLIKYSKHLIITEDDEYELRLESGECATRLDDGQEENK